MAISFKGFINSIKKAFTPAEYMNVETGELYNRRSYKKLSKAEQENTINLKRTPIQQERATAQTLDSTSHESYRAKAMPNINAPATRNTPIDGGLGFRRGRGKTKSDIDTPTTTTRKRTPKVPVAPAVKKKKSSTMPQKPPKTVVKQLEERMSAPAPTVNNIDELKKRLQELERKAYPYFDVEQPKAMLLSIVENAEAYYENEVESYYQYLTENEETIANLIADIEYRASDQEEFNNAVTNLATILNMQPLSHYESEELSEMLERNSYNE